MPSELFRTHTGVRLLSAQAAMQRQRGRKLEAETAEPGAQETVRPMENKDWRHGWGSCVVIHRARAPPPRRGWLCILRSQHHMHYEAGLAACGDGKVFYVCFSGETSQNNSEEKDLEIDDSKNMLWLLVCPK